MRHWLRDVLGEVEERHNKQDLTASNAQQEAANMGTMSVQNMKIDKVSLKVSFLDRYSVHLSSNCQKKHLEKHSAKTNV